MSVPFADEATKPNPHLPLEFSSEKESIKITGFWMFLVTDVLVFASLFSVYAVYRHAVAQGPTPGHLYTLGPVILETLLLLTSSFTIGIGIYAMRIKSVKLTTLWVIITLILGAAFVTTEVHDFVTYIASGATWHQSAFLSGFYILVGTHGAHVSFGIFWAITILLQLKKRGFTAVTTRKLFTFSLYWHFLDIVWVFIFTFVYLGAKI